MNSKYLKYALGEIALVVVGILIALQINNWNEQRKLNKEETQILANLKLDFSLRLNELQEFNNYSHLELSAIDEILRIGNKEVSYTEAETDSLLSYLFNGYGFNESFKLLDLLFNTGKIDLIQNQELKDELLVWPWLVEEHLEEVRMAWKISNEQEQTILNQYVSQGDIAQYYVFRDYNFPTKVKPKLSKDYDGLFDNQEFINLLLNRRHILNVMYIDRTKLVEKAQNILQLIEK